MGIGQSELAARVGVSPRTIRAWEWGNRALKGRKFPTLLEVLGMETPLCIGGRYPMLNDHAKRNEHKEN